MTIEKMLDRQPYFFALDRELANRLLEILAKGKSALDAAGDTEGANDATRVIGEINGVLEGSCRLHAFPEESPDSAQAFFVWAKDARMRKDAAVIDFWCVDARGDGRWLVSGVEPLYWLELPKTGPAGSPPEAASSGSGVGFWF